MEGIADDSLFDHVDKMISFNLRSAISCSHLASKFLAPGGLLVLTGAKAALEPTGWAIAYGTTKAATHQLIKSLAADGSGLPANSSVVGILPITLDTPANRKSMPDADTTTWTPVEELGSKLVSWADGNDRAASGALVEVATKDSKTSYNVIG